MSATCAFGCARTCPSTWCPRSRHAAGAAAAAQRQGGSQRAARSAGGGTARVGRPRPASGVERAIAGVWSEVLGIDRVGPEDNFFDLGGHSLLMCSVHGRLQQLYGDAVSTARSLRVSDRRAPRRRTSPAGCRRLRQRSGRRGRRTTVRTTCAVIGMACRFPGAADAGRVLAQPARRRRVDRALLATRSCSRPAVAGADRAIRGYVKACGALDGHRSVRRGVLRHQPARSRDARSAAPHVPRVRVGGARATPATTPSRYRRRRSACSRGVGTNTYCLRNLQSPPGVLARASARLQALIANDKDYLADARVLQAEPARAERHRADRLLDVARRDCTWPAEACCDGECDMALAGGVIDRACRRSPGYLLPEGGDPLAATATAARSTRRPTAPSPAAASASSCSSGWRTRSPTATRSTP